MLNNDTYALALNVVSIFFLTGLSIMMFVTRKHHRTGVAAMISIVTTTIPIYIYNLLFIMRDLKTAMWIAPFAYIAGTAFMPTLWLFIHKHINPNLKFSSIRIVHFIPTLLCLSLYVAYMLSLSFPERVNFFLDKSAHMSALMEYLNVAIIGTQIIVYYSIIFIYLSHIKKFVVNSFSKAEWVNNMWIPRMLIILTFIFSVQLICHHLLKRNDTWILNILDMIIMGYFTVQAMTPKEDILPKVAVQNDNEYDALMRFTADMKEGDSQKYAKIISDYANRTKCFLNPELDIKILSHKTGISQEKITQSLKEIYNTNFFDFINKLRIERAINVLKEDTHNQQTIDTITFQSGFASREDFLKAFKYYTGKSLSQWLKDIGSTNII